MNKALSFILISLIGHVSFAQSNRTTDRNTIGWFTATVTPQLSKKISLHGEYQWRRVKLIKEWQQSLLRVGLTYKINPQVAVQVGYAWVPTFPYGNYNLSAVPKVFPEHRVYEQIVLSATIGKSTLINRLRLEQRWIGRFSSIEAEKPAFIYLNRFRYMPRIDIPLTKNWYTGVYDEIFIGFGKNVGENIFDQNRLGALIGYKASGIFRVEGGYLSQIVQLGREIENKNVFQNNKGIIINTYFNF